MLSKYMSVCLTFCLSIISFHLVILGWFLTESTRKKIKNVLQRLAAKVVGWIDFLFLYAFLGHFALDLDFFAKIMKNFYAVVLFLSEK